MTSSVVRPQVPYRGPVPGGVHEGKLIEIRGVVPYGADLFEINLLTGLDPSSDRPLHISVRFNGRIVVRNTLQQNTWGPEERVGIFPFASGRDFTMLILVTSSAYRIAVNSQHCWEYPHRIPYTRVSSIHIAGSVQLERIEFISKITPGMPSTTCVPFPSVTPGIPATTCVPLPSVTPGIPATTCVPVPPSNPITYPGCIVPPPEQICPTPGVGMRPNPVLSPVYNPSIPYAYPIYGGLKPGMMIYISGRPSASAYRMTLNLQSGTAPYPPPDIAFHFDVRFYNHTIVRNTRNNNVWANEETLASHFPFQQAVNFDMIIRVDSERYMIAVNGQHFIEFRHRLHPFSRFDTLYIENDIIVSSIRFA